MQKTKTLSFFVRKGAPVGPRFFQQGESSSDIRANEIFRSADGAVHMTLCRKVHDPARLICFQ